MPRKILVIEDDKDMAGILLRNLEDAGYEVTTASDGGSGLAMAKADEHDLIILDLMLPEIDGLEVCRQVRGMPSYTPVLMLTCLSSEVDKVVGLEMGADDYMTKPFSLRELLARIKAILRRDEALRSAENSPPSESVKRGDLLIDTDKRRVTRGEEPVELTAREFDLLLHLARHPGRVYSRQQLLDQVWGYGYEGYAYTVNSHINKLRSKLEPDRDNPRYVQTVWGVGYRFSDDLDQA